MENTTCPEHEVDVRKNGYSIGDGWARCGINANEPKFGVCLFTRKVTNG